MPPIPFLTPTDSDAVTLTLAISAKEGHYFHVRFLTMSLFQKLIATFAFAVIPPLGHADGLIFKLPPDGTSATFKIEIKGEGSEVSGTLRVSSVGVVEEDWEKSRWIEFKTKVNAPGQLERVIRAKLLIPETHLGKGKSGFENFIKGLQLQQGGLVEAIDPENPPRSVGPLAAFLSGPLREQKELEPAEIDSSLGKRECPGVSGTMRLKDGPMDVIIEVETRFHDDAPFGVFHSEMEFKVLRGEEKVDGGVISLTLDSVGEGVKSELPDEVPKEEE